MKNWLARKRQELSREHPPLSSYEAGDLVYVTAGGSYQGKIAQIAPRNSDKHVDLVDPLTLKSLTRLLSAECISPALEHEAAEVHNRRANEVYFVTHQVALRRDSENKQIGDFCPVYKVLSVSPTSGGVKLENIATGEVLTGEDGEPEYILRAIELRPPTSSETRHAKDLAHARQAVQISGPDGAEVKSGLMKPDDAAKIEKNGAANGSCAFNLRDTLGELSEGHQILTSRLSKLKLRKPFKGALTAEKAGKPLAADQRSAVELIHAMEDALKRAREAERGLTTHKDKLVVGLRTQDHDQI